jgi:hypothetical protein
VKWAGRGSEQRQIAQDLLLALGQRRLAVKLHPVRGLGAVILDAEGEPAPIVQGPRQVFGIGLLGGLGPGHLDEPVERLAQRAPLVG